MYFGFEPFTKVEQSTNSDFIEETIITSKNIIVENFKMLNELYDNNNSELLTKCFLEIKITANIIGEDSLYSFLNSNLQNNTFYNMYKKRYAINKQILSNVKRIEGGFAVTLLLAAVAGLYAVSVNSSIAVKPEAFTQLDSHLIKTITDNGNVDIKKGRDMFIRGTQNTAGQCTFNAAMYVGVSQEKINNELKKTAEKRISDNKILSKGSYLGTPYSQFLPEKVIVDSNKNDFLLKTASKYVVTEYKKIQTMSSDSIIMFKCAATDLNFAHAYVCLAREVNGEIKTGIADINNFGNVIYNAVEKYNGEENISNKSRIFSVGDSQIISLSDETFMFVEDDFFTSNELIILNKMVTITPTPLSTSWSKVTGTQLEPIRLSYENVSSMTTLPESDVLPITQISYASFQNFVNLRDAMVSQITIAQRQLKPVPSSNTKIKIESIKRDSEIKIQPIKIDTGIKIQPVKIQKGSSKIKHKKTKKNNKFKKITSFKKNNKFKKTKKQKSKIK